MKKDKKNRGFTLIELAVVIMITGFLMAAAIQVYSAYLHDKRYRETVSVVNTAYSSLYHYQSSNGRFPYPSDPTIPLDNIDGGCECGSCTATETKCALLAALPGPYPNCIGGICKIVGARDTPVDADEIVDNDFVFTGGLPYKTIKGGIEKFPIGTALGKACTLESDPTIYEFCDADANGGLDLGVKWSPTTQATFEDISHIGVVDPWGYQMSYAVTAAATGTSTIAQGTNGAIDVRTEANISLLNPVGSANFIIIAHGDNHMGAYTPAGKMPFPCVAGKRDFNNCNDVSLFIDGLRSTAQNSGYYDDVVAYSAFALSKVWDYTEVGSEDIYNLNPGNVGIGLAAADEPEARLEVVGSVQADKAIQGRICNSLGTNCWEPNYLAGPESGPNKSDNLCDQSDVPAGHSNVVRGFRNGKVICTEVGSAHPPVPHIKVPLNASCPNATGAGRFVIGFYVDTAGAPGVLCSN